MYLRKYVPIAIGIILLAVCFYDYDYGQLHTIFRGINYYILIPVFIFELGNMYVRSQRLRVILSPLARINGASIFSYYSIGSFANAALPAFSGQVVRTLLFARKYKITKTSFATSAGLEVLFDGMCLFALMIGISFMAKLPAWLISWKMSIGVTVIGIAVLLLLIVFNHRLIAESCRRIEHRVPSKLVPKISSCYNSFVESLSMLRSSRHVTAVSFLSMLSWALNGVIVYLMFMAFGFSMSPWAAYLLVVVISLSLMIVVTPGNVGTFNLACILGLSLFGVDKTQALSFSILLYVVTFLPIMVTGLVFALKEGVSLAGLKSSATAGP